jgi:hypothetical protein
MKMQRYTHSLIHFVFHVALPAQYCGVVSARFWTCIRKTQVLYKLAPTRLFS